MNRESNGRSGVAGFAVAVVVCVAGGAHAVPGVGMKPAGSPAELAVKVSHSERASVGVPTSGERGLLGPVLMRDDLEGYTLGGVGGQTSAPSFLDPPGFPWGMNRLAGQSAGFVSIVDLSGAPLGGSNGVVNASQALRLFTNSAQPSGGFFAAANMRWDPILVPGAGTDAVGSYEGYISTVAETYTFDTVNTVAGFITARLYWGGPCNPDIHGECGGINPTVPPPNFYFLGLDPESFTTGIFMPSAYCLDAQGNAIPGCVPPAGVSVGDPAAVPTQNWVRLSWAFGADGTMTALLDLQDGSGAVPIAQSMLLTSASLDRVGWNSGFGVQSASMHIDNIEASGYVFEQPTPPPFECPFFDDIEWLNPGPLLGQSAQWFAPLGGSATVVDDGAHGQVLQQVNAGFDFYTESASRTLPEAFASAGNPWTFCVDAMTTGETVRAFTLESEAGLTARVFVGYLDDTDPQNPVFDPSVFVQINPGFDPLAGDEPVIGVDIVSTGFQWTAGEYHEVCMTVGVGNAFDLSIDGASVYTGSAFAAAVAGFGVESGNNASGEGDALRIDDLSLDCTDLPVVTPPALTLPYCDDFEWANLGVPVGENPGAEGRYSSNSEVTVESVSLAPGGASQVVVMPNVFHDTAHTPMPDINGQPFIFTQFSADTPSIAVSPFTGWRVSMDLAMNDFLTSRGVAPAQLADVGNGAELVGYLWYHAPNDRFYLFASADDAQPTDDLLNIDTGFTRAGLGITADTVFRVVAEYIPTSGKIRWSINGTVVGATNPIVGTDDLGDPRVHENLDFVFVFSGDDDTAPGVPPLSTMYLDNLCVDETDRCYADLNGDGIVNFSDFNAVLNYFGQSQGLDEDFLPGDVNLDGVVNFSDLNAVLAQYGTDGCN